MVDSITLCFLHELFATLFISALRFKGFVLPMTEPWRLQLRRHLQPGSAGRRLRMTAGCISVSTHLFTYLLTTAAEGSLSEISKA